MLKIRPLNEMSLYCVITSTACPDYKRPSVRFDVRHFKTLKAARIYQQQMVQRFASEHGICANKQEEFDDRVYRDSYMDMDGFSCNIHTLDMETMDLKRYETIARLKTRKIPCDCEACHSS